MVTSMIVEFLAIRKLDSISDAVLQGLKWVEILEVIGISVVYCFTSCLSVVRMARGVISWTIKPLRIAIASCLKAVLLESVNKVSRAVPEMSCA